MAYSLRLGGSKWRQEMGRCRAASATGPADDDPNHRLKRKRAASENSETLATGDFVMITSHGCPSFQKCAVCQDFDLCIECFSVGAEVTPHKSNHPYRVMVFMVQRLEAVMVTARTELTVMVTAGDIKTDHGERAIEEMREESGVNFQRLSDMEDVMRRRKNIERGSEGSRGSVNRDKVGRREEIDDEWEEDKREYQWGDEKSGTSFI
ncbi:hypothetical protein V8G54_033862 [Vigna mungo]|uniref:ZZ-type domain-containing protein n=1 Tax=Vigna mungo TaxID=3915 RepID=A0AAQ3MQ53_VIGMU